MAQLESCSCGSAAQSTHTTDARGAELSVWTELRESGAESGAMLPKPGSGRTPARFAALADWATRDLSLARLVEGHVDALAILEEAGGKADSGVVYGVWAARQSAGG